MWLIDRLYRHCESFTILKKKKKLIGWEGSDDPRVKHRSFSFSNGFLARSCGGLETLRTSPSFLSHMSSRMQHGSWSRYTRRPTIPLLRAFRRLFIVLSYRPKFPGHEWYHDSWWKKCGCLQVVPPLEPFHPSLDEFFKVRSLSLPGWRRKIERTSFSRTCCKELKEEREWK